MVMVFYHRNGKVVNIMGFLKKERDKKLLGEKISGFWRGSGKEWVCVDKVTIHYMHLCNSQRRNKNITMRAPL